MSIEIREFLEKDLEQMTQIWNGVVADGNAFPQDKEITVEQAKEFFLSQSLTAVACDGENVLGLYILHPNNVGRCSHICNASYAVKKDERGRHIGEALVKDCLIQAKRLGFKILQFNAVVKTNERALRLYKKLGFIPLGVIPNGFLMKDGTYEDIIPHYIEL